MASPLVLNFTTPSTLDVVGGFRITITSLPAAVPVMFTGVAITIGSYLKSIPNS